MHIQIKHRYTDAVLHEGDYVSLLEAISAARRTGANLTGADLTRADLTAADLTAANLTRADLTLADLTGANLTGANLDMNDKNARLALARTRHLPEGDIIGYKKVRGEKIVKLLIPANAKRSHAFGRKSRAEFANVLAVYDKDGNEVESGYTDAHGPRTVYKTGEIVKPNGWSEDWKEECAQGIHFFITREEAEDYLV